MYSKNFSSNLVLIVTVGMDPCHHVLHLLQLLWSIPFLPLLLLQLSLELEFQAWVLLQHLRIQEPSFCKLQDELDKLQTWYRSTLGWLDHRRLYVHTYPLLVKWRLMQLARIHSFFPRRLDRLQL